MSPVLLLTILLACLLALIPVWRLHVAGWPAGSLFTAWVIYAVGILVMVKFPGPFKFLLPVLVVALLAPFVAGPERLSRVLGGRRPPAPTIIDVTPRPAPGLRGPKDDDEAGEADR